MNPRSNLTLKKPTNTNVNQKKNSELHQLLDSTSPDIRRSVEQCMADLNTGYRSTVTGGLKKIAMNQGNKKKSTIRMAAVRKQQRSEYLESKRPHIHDNVQTPSSSSTVEIETLAAGGASSLESLRHLVTERKEYLEMSQNRKRKVQWYERVTRQSEQLLNFLRANDQSAGDTFVNNAANLVLVQAPATAESRRQEQQSLPQSVSSGATSGRPQLFTSVQIITETTLNRPQNGIAPLKCENERNDSAPETRNISGSKIKRNMEKPTGYDGMARQDDTNRGPNKRKRYGSTNGFDKENKELVGQNLDMLSAGHRTTAGACNNYSNRIRKDGTHFDRTPGTATLNFNNFNNINNSTTNSYNIGLKNGEKGSSPTRKMPGVYHPSNQLWSTMKRKRIIWASNAKTGGLARYTGAEAMGPVPEAVDPSAEAMGPVTEARGPVKEPRAPRLEDSLWMSLTKIWKKEENRGRQEMRQEGEAEFLSRASSLEDDPIKGGPTNPYKTTSRARVGRTIKRRRRDAKSSPVRTPDDDADVAVGPHVDPQTWGTGTGRSFVIPDRPYNVEEALSMDLMNTAYDFIHNG